MLKTNADDLLLEIALCPNVRDCIASPNDPHPCRAVVQTQKSRSLSDHQVPEPWSGALAEAPLLFVSSNPSISDTEEYPRWESSAERLRRYFNERFRESIREGLYPLQRDGGYPKTHVAFWAEARSRAAELFGPRVIPGIDYVLTEVVHCKSRKNMGVRDAVIECSSRYLDRLLAYSPARAIVPLGKIAGAVFRDRYDLSPGPGLQHAAIGGRKRLVVFLGAPGSNQARKFANVLLPAEFRELRSRLGCN